MKEEGEEEEQQQTWIRSEFCSSIKSKKPRDEGATFIKLLYTSSSSLLFLLGPWDEFSVSRKLRYIELYTVTERKIKWKRNRLKNPTDVSMRKNKSDQIQSIRMK